MNSYLEKTHSNVMEMRTMLWIRSGRHDKHRELLPALERGKVKLSRVRKIKGQNTQ
jgi:hypothetical protein